MSEDNDDSSSSASAVSDTSAATSLTDEEWSIIQSLHEKADDENKSLNQVVVEALPTLSPKLLMKLRQGSASKKSEYLEVAAALESCLDTRLQAAAAQLQEFLAAGELLDGGSVVGVWAVETELPGVWVVFR